MKTNARILFGLAIFFALADVAYIVANLVFKHLGNSFEPVGTVAITMSVFMALFPAYFLWKADKSVGRTLPEDDVNAKIEEADPDYGFYSPWSWWPLVLGAALGFTFFGLAVDTWVTIIGMIFVTVGIIGFTFEFYRTRHAH